MSDNASLSPAGLRPVRSTSIALSMEPVPVPVTGRAGTRNAGIGGVPPMFDFGIGLATRKGDGVAGWTFGGPDGIGEP